MYQAAGRVRASVRVRYSRRKTYFSRRPGADERAKTRAYRETTNEKAFAFFVIGLCAYLAAINLEDEVIKETAKTYVLVVASSP